MSLDVARTFKNGVPPPGSQGVIFSVQPPPASVVLNLDCWLREPAFVEAVETHKSDISRYYDGIRRYGNQQREVVLEISRIQITDIHELGGYSSNREELIEIMLLRGGGSASYTDRHRSFSSLVLIEIQRKCNQRKDE